MGCSTLQQSLIPSCCKCSNHNQFTIRDCVGFSCTNTRLPSLPSSRVPTWNGSPEIPTGCSVVGTCVLLCDRSCSALFSTKESMWWTYHCSSVLLRADPTGPEPDTPAAKRIQSSLKQKVPMLSLTRKTVLIVPHTVEQKIQRLERKPPNHTTIVKPISLSLPLEKRSLCVLLAAGLSSDRHRCLAVPGDTECCILNQHKTDSTTSWESNVHACS